MECVSLYTLYNRAHIYMLEYIYRVSICNKLLFMNFKMT